MRSKSEMKTLKIGDHIPAIILNNQFGDLINIDDYLGEQNLVIYFYPKDNTYGCTAEACKFRDAYEEFKKYNCSVIGVSSDDEESHKQFAIKNKLSFNLLSDRGNRVRRRFGIASNLFGLIPGRVTFVVDKKGIIQYIFNSQLNISKHIFTSLEILKKLK
jgi:peroxiredoxin Q/BCP